MAVKYKYNKDTHKFEHISNVVWIKDIEDIAASLVDQFNAQESKLEYLREENQKLKEGIWEKEEFSRMKQEYEQMKADYYRGFPISKDEDIEIQKFIKKYRGQKFGTIGGAFKYVFNPTSVGTSGVIVGPDGEELEFQKIR